MRISDWSSDVCSSDLRPRSGGRGGALSISRHLENFLEMLAAERGAAANTIAAYRRDLEDAVAFFANRGLAETAASADDLRDYLARLNRAGMAPTTTARRLSALRQFYRFLFEIGRASCRERVCQSV